MIAWHDLRLETRRRLEESGIETADAESRWLVEDASGLEGAEYLLASMEPATERAVAAVDEGVARRIKGEPIQYVLGHWQFLDLDLLVKPGVLIPRPETEVVARVAIDALELSGARRGRPNAWIDESAFDVIDLGTGSGALALALVSEIPGARVWAVDSSSEAIEVARANTAGLGSAGARVSVVDGDWFDALPAELRGATRLVVSNPPYVSEDEYVELPVSVRDYEPRGALVAGPTGREDLERIVDEAYDWLEPGGILVLELAPHHADEIGATASARGYSEVGVHRDLTGRARALIAKRG